MSLSNFYDEADEVSRQRRMVAGAVMLALLLIVGISYRGCQPTSQQEVQRIIDRSSDLRDLDRFCRELPRPPGFNYRHKRLAGNSKMSFINYRFVADTDVREVSDFYNTYFERQGWVVEKFMLDADVRYKDLSLKFRQGKRTVWISSGGVYHGVGCGLDT